jgi:hypothetical protein
VDAPRAVIAAYSEELARPNREPAVPATEVSSVQVVRVQIPESAARVATDAPWSKWSPGDAARQRGWRNAKPSQVFARKNLEAARARIAKINVAAQIEKALGTVRGWDIPGKVSAASERVRRQAEPHVTSFRRNAGPILRSYLAATRSYARARSGEARDWFFANFRADTYGRNLAAAFGLSVGLYLIGRAINPEQGWQHPALVTLTFTAFLLAILSLCLTVGILVRARQSVLRDSATVLGPALRWLRAPIYTMQMRELTSAGGKVDGERRA